MGAQIKELVALAQKGDADAFGELYELYYKELYHYACYVTGDEDLAQDAVSEAVISAFEQIKSLKNPNAFKGWLFRILCASCKRHYTENEKKKSVVYLDDENGGYRDPVATGDMELSLELKRALDTLTREEREIVLLSSLHKYKSHEIAQILDCPSSTVRSKLKRALAKLRIEMSGEN